MKLAIVEHPPIVCYNHHAHFLSVLFTNPEFIDEFFNYYVQLQLIIGDEVVMNFVNIITSSCNKLFESFRIIFSNSTDKCSKPLFDMIDVVGYAERVISEGYYLTGSWDEMFVPSAEAYNSYSLLHDYLIYGFNATKRTFNIIGYDKTLKYCSSTISYDEMRNAFYMPGTNSSLVAFKLLKDANYAFDLSGFICNLKEYYNDCSENSSFFGLSAIRKYLEILKDTASSDLDLRVVQVIYEHKKTMIERINYLIQKGYIFSDDIVNTYEHINRQSLILKNLAFKFNKVRSEVIIRDMYSILNDIVAKEIIIIPRFIDELILLMIPQNEAEFI